jgi:adenylate cyclase
VDRVRVKGKDIPSRVYELLAPRSEPGPVDLAAWERALALYRSADWSAAAEAFQALLVARPGDGPARVLLERIARLRAAGLTADGWDGIFDMETK